MSLFGFRGGLRRHLVLLVLAVLVPTLLLTAAVTVWASVQEQRAIERGLLETARALTLAVDQEIRLTVTALESTAVAFTQFKNGQEDADLWARRLKDMHPEWASVMVVSPQLRQEVNTILPPASPLPGMDGPALLEAAATIRHVVESGQPAVSNVFFAPLAQDWVVLAAAPVLDGEGKVVHVLAALVKAERLAQLLQRQQMPEGWLAAIDDRNLAIVARTPNHRETVGKPAQDWFRRAVADKDSGIAMGRSLDDIQLGLAFKRSTVTGWTVVFGAPRAIFIRTLVQSLGVTIGFGLLVLTGSLMLAFAIARRILRPVEALSAAAQPFLVPGKPVTKVFPVTELDTLHRALDGLTDQLARTQQRVLTFFAVAPVMLWVLDEEGRLSAVNDAWLRLLGYQRHEVLGRRQGEFLGKESSAYDDAVIRPEFLQHGSLDGVPMTYLTKDGVPRDILVSLRADRDEQGHIVRTIGAGHDVTEQRLAEKALARAVEEAERANNSKSRFLAAASHDLRQPLQALSLYLGVLKSRLNGREEPVMDAVGQCVESLSGLLTDLLDVARLDAGVITARPVEVPVARLLERATAAWRIQAEAKGLTLRVRDCNAVVRTDPALMDRVLSNLVANAVRYTDKGRVLVGCRRQADDQIRLEVWDTGQGIPSDKLGEIFEEFRQLGNQERRRDKGSGLGLAIVRRIVDLLGHRLEVRSEVGKGTLFSVTMPSVAQPAPVAVQPRHEGKEKRRILVVDDEVHVRQALEMVLSELGHDVVAADNQEQALAQVRQLRPELVIADFRLAGGKTGIDVIRAVRDQCGTQVPAVVLTGDTDPATIKNIAGAGLHLLQKPLQLEALRSFLKRVA